MKMRYTGISVVMCLLFCCLAVSQETTSVPSAAQQIEQLKNGTLLIKLNTQSARVEHRLKAGQKNRAQQLIEEVEQEHDAIIASFKNNYTFGDYYFFYSDDSDEVITKQNYENLFLEKNRKITSSLDVRTPFVLILGIPPGYSTVDKYKFILHALQNGGIKQPAKSLPKVFKTQSNKLFSNKYDFVRAVKKMQERLQKFYDESKSEQ